MFGSAKPASDDPTVPPEELSWFSKYFTLRNFVSGVIVLVGALWTFFTWYSADKGAQLTDALNKAAAADRRAELEQKSREQIEKDIAHWKKNSDDLTKEASKKDEELSKLKEDLSKETSKADTLSSALDQAQKEKNKLIEALKGAAQK